MTSDSPPSDATSTLSNQFEIEKSKIQISLKSQAGALLIILPKETETPVTTGWIDLWEQLQVRLQGGDRFWSPQAPVYLVAQDRLLDSRQLKEIADAVESVDLNLQKVITYRRQTAIAAASSGYSVEQTPNLPTLLSDNPEKLSEVLADPLYLQMTVRSGVEISHPGTAIVLGDVNPGGSVVAAGDILVWGRLRGIAHAGAKGNSNCRIMALEMQPTQLRIAGYVARAPQKQLTHYVPEVAYVTQSGIRISPC
jgi:septum site-determining protein MinC